MTTRRVSSFWVLREHFLKYRVTQRSRSPQTPWNILLLILHKPHLEKGGEKPFVVGKAPGGKPAAYPGFKGCGAANGASELQSSALPRALTKSFLNWSQIFQRKIQRELWECRARQECWLLAPRGMRVEASASAGQAAASRALQEPVPCQAGGVCQGSVTLWSYGITLTTGLPLVEEDKSEQTASSSSFLPLKPLLGLKEPEPNPPPGAGGHKESL